MRTVSLIILCMVLLSCGTRKSLIEKSKDKVEVEVKQEVQEQSKQEVRAEVVETESKANDVVNEDTETIIERSFNLDPTGQPYLANEKITNRKLSNIDKSKTDKTTISVLENSGEINRNEVLHYDSLSKSSDKTKSVEADKTLATNFGGWWVVVILGVIVGLVWYFRR